MGGSCGWTIVQKIEYIINGHGRLHEKKKTHMLGRNKSMLQSIWVQKKKKTYNCAYEIKYKKKEKEGRFLESSFQQGDMTFPDCQQH